MGEDGVLLNSYRQSTHDFLESLDAAVLLIDKTMRVRAGNSRAQEIIGKKIDRFKDFLSGEALECVYAYLPGGCGRSEHCQTCAIRKAVTETIESGRSVEKRAAYLDVSSDRGPKRIRLYISTEKVEGIILLRIDELSEIGLQ